MTKSKSKSWELGWKDLALYQVKTQQFIERVPRGLVFLDLGLGKTISTMGAIRNLFDRFEISRVLIVAPLAVATGTWPAELAKWEQGTGLRAVHIEGSGKQLKDRIAQRAPLHIVSRDGVRKLSELLGTNSPYDMIVVDESSSFRNPDSRRWKMLDALAAQCKRIVCLTATPSPNGYHQLWAQAYLCDRGQRLGKTYSAFLRRFFHNDTGSGFHPRPGARDQIVALLQDITIGLRAQDHIDLPALTKRSRVVRMPDAFLEAYEAFEDNAILHVDTGDRFAFNAGALTQKLQQYTSGAMYTNPETKEWALLHTAKMDALAEIAEDAQSPLLVAYQFKHELVRLKERFPGAEVIKDPESVKRWNRGEVPIGLMHPASSGMGLNLQAGGHHLIFYSAPWDAEHYIQTVGRLHRQGQKNPVIVLHLVIKGTIDEVIMSALGRKEVSQEALLEALKTYIEKSA